MTTSNENSQYGSMCARVHPEYQEKLDHWDFLLSTYESKRDWFKRNLFQFVREGAETYAGRLARAYRFNHTREVVDLVNKYLFKVEPQRSEDVPEYIKRFRTKSTLSGLPLAEFERQVSRLTSIFGRIYVVVDSNNAGDRQAISVADEKAGDVRLYAYTVHPQDFLDCGYDDDGQFTWVLLREKTRDDQDPFKATGACVTSYRLWTRTEWFLIKTVQKKDKLLYQLDKRGMHDLGVVPVIKADHIESDNPYAVPALIEDIAYLDRAVANYLSNLDQIINDQTFSQLVLPVQGMLGGASSAGAPTTEDPATEEARARKNLLAMGTSQVLLYDGEGGAAPAYISPDPRQAALIVSTVKQIINEIYHTVGLAGERTKQDNSLGIDNSSGVAKAYDFERVNGLLGAKANAMQNFSNRLETLVGIWNGAKVTLDTPVNKNTLYSTNFDVRSLADDLTIASQLGLLSVPMELRRMQLTGVVQKLWPMLAKADAATLTKAIANWEDAIYASPVAPNSTGAESQSVVTDAAPGEKGSDKPKPA